MDLNKLPDAYAAGYKDFLGTKIGLSKRPLIPREETEYWVGLAIEEVRESSKDKKTNCLDLFSGSGCIGIALLKNIKGASCDFGEIKDDFLEQIRINLDLNQIDPSRYKIIKTDVFSNIADKYDFILANPPYVAEERIAEIGEDVKKYEPMVALMGGRQGMDLIKIFLTKAFENLNENGVAYMEIDPQQKELIEEIINNPPPTQKSYGGQSKYEFMEDQFGKTRVLKITK
jgi:release factor glutamine methyltransferase